MDQPPPTLTSEDMLLKDLIAVGVKEALVGFQETVSGPKLDEVVEKHGEDLKRLAKASLDGLLESMSQSATKQLDEHERKLTKRAKALLKTSAQNVDTAVQQHVNKICEGLHAPLAEKNTELVSNAVSEIKVAINKVHEASQKVTSMSMVALTEVKEDLDKFLDTKLRIEKSLKAPMTAEEPFLIDTSVDGGGNLFELNMPNNEQSGSDSESSLIPFAVENKDSATVVENLQEVKAKIMARQRERGENPYVAGPSNISKKKKLTLSTKPEPAPLVIDSSSEDDPPPAAPSAARAAPKPKKVSFPQRPEQQEIIPENNKEQCPICLGPIENKVTLECAQSHSFCKDHIEEWLKFRSVCPLCNTEVDFFQLPQ